MKSSFARPPAPAGSAPRPTAPPPPARTAVPAPAVRTAPPLPPRRTAPVAAAPAPEPETIEAEVVQEPVAETPTPAAPPKKTRGPARAATPAPTPQSQLPAVQNTTLATGGIPRIGEGIADIDPATDLQLPQLKIASAVGPLALLEPPVPPGTIVVGAGDQQSYLWQPDCEPVGVTVLWYKRGLAQKTNDKGQNLFDLEEQGCTFYDPGAAAQMQDFGGTLDDGIAKAQGRALFSPLLMCMVAIRMPAGLEDEYGMFNMEVPGVEVPYMLAMWYIRGSAYGDCARKIFTERSGFLKDGSHKVEFLMEGKYIKGTKNAWWIPKLVNGAANPPALIQYLEENA